MCLSWCLSSLPGEDVWSYARTLPHLFQQGGVFYNIVKKDMGTFVLFFSSVRLCATLRCVVEGRHGDRIPDGRVFGGSSATCP